MQEPMVSVCLRARMAGGHWIDVGLANTEVYALAIDPSNPNILYAGTFGAGVFKSTDGGAHWTTLNTGLTDTRVSSLAIDPSNPNILYAGTPGVGVFKSTDGGGHWIDVGLANTEVYALAIDPSNPNILYAGTFDAGVFKSTDGGGDWDKRGAGQHGGFIPGHRPFKSKHPLCRNYF